MKEYLVTSHKLTNGNLMNNNKTISNQVVARPFNRWTTALNTIPTQNSELVKNFLTRHPVVPNSQLDDHSPFLRSCFNGKLRKLADSNILSFSFCSSIG